MDVDGSEDPAGDIDTLVNNCKFSMKLQMVDSAWKQVMEKKKSVVLSYFYLHTHLAAKPWFFRITFLWLPRC